MKTPSAITVSLLCVAGLALPAAPALAKSGDVARTGNCSGTTDSKLKAKARDGAIELEYEVDSNRVEQKWNYTLKHNGSVFASGSRRTLAPSGSFTVSRRVSNLAGIDRLAAVATRPASGEKCQAVLSF